ncbi:DUF1643 domain-containing protein [Lacticaseibacillus jixianensis]|uniref:DUF1643 domain-containing protein n=1 Tax=Lacticaseibacillus jixianensis TaxID=2486012 RepID=A0ABW4BBA2_9LACO|nr:DUF1643 domain-containing protein [Lacticaseibacillus jixianensis]
MIKLFDDSKPGDVSETWTYNIDFNDTNIWVDGSQLSTSKQYAKLKIWKGNYYLRQLAGTDSANKNQMVYYETVKKDKVGKERKSILATNYRRYVLEIKQKKSIKDADEVLVLLMKNPSSANVIEADTTANLAAHLLNSKLDHYNHIIILNLLPVVTRGVIRLRGYVDDISNSIENVMYRKESIRLPIEERAGDGHLSAETDSQTTEITAEEMKKHIKLNCANIIHSPGHLSLNRRIISNVIKELDDHQINYDVMIATGAIDGANSPTIDGKTKSMGKDAQLILLDQYKKIMEIVTTPCKGDVNNPKHRLLSTIILKSSKTYGYSRHPSATTKIDAAANGLPNPIGIQLNSKGEPSDILWDEDSTQLQDGGLRERL